MIVRATALGALVIAGAPCVVALPAEAATAYRYWSYWTAEPHSTEWQYATEGSGTHVPSDGAVEGWRFGIAGEAARIQPDLVPDFASICGDAEVSSESKRVAVIIDPGTSAEAPEDETPSSVSTECVVTDEGSTGLQILQAIATVRMDAGFVCGIDGYPARECAPLVEMPEASAASVPAATTQQDTSMSSAGVSEPAGVIATPGTPLFTAAGVSLFALLGFGIWRRRRRERV